MNTYCLNGVRLHLWCPSLSHFGGGIGAFSRELAQTLLTEVDPQYLHLFSRADRGGSWNGVAMTGAGSWPEAHRSAVMAAAALYWACREQPKLIVSTHVNFGPVARLIRRCLGIRYALVAHGIDVHGGLSAARLRALREADAVWAVSRWARDRVLAAGVAEERISMVANTFREELFETHGDALQLRERYRIGASERVILTVGRLHSGEAYKGHDLVIEAIPKLLREFGKVRYLIVGAGDDASRLTRLADSLGVADIVTLCGYVPDAELPAHYRLANVFAMPSRAEGFGIVYLEAMACGVPVLAGNSDGSADALADGELGLLVDPAQRSAVSEGLLQLLRKNGPECWFEPTRLRQAVIQHFGRASFRASVQHALGRVLLPASG